MIKARNKKERYFIFINMTIGIKNTWSINKNSKNLEMHALNLILYVKLSLQLEIASPQSLCYASSPKEIPLLFVLS